MIILRILLLVGGLAGINGLPQSVLAQSNWKMAADTSPFNLNDTAKIAPSGAVAISHQHQHPLRNMLLVSTRYDSLLARGLYVGMNEPGYELDPPDSTAVGLIARPYKTKDFDLINLRLFTDNEVGNPAELVDCQSGFWYHHTFGAFLLGKRIALANS